MKVGVPTEIMDEEYRVAGYDFGRITNGVNVPHITQIGFYGAPRTVAVTASYRY